VRTLAAALCTLEPQLAAHAPEMFQVLGDPAIYEFENAPPESEARLAERYARLETRFSNDGSEQWLNWVVRLPDGKLAGYVQATVVAGGVGYVAYELASRYWRRGIGSCAVRALIGELVTHYGVRTVVAILKARNHRSLALLEHLGFARADPVQSAAHGADEDEIVMMRAGTAGRE
jgi:RimJ/RimL family protein N-acetyltransferase